VLDIGGFTGTLEVVYRSLTPLHQPIRMRSWIEREEGSKIFIHGTMHTTDPGAEERLCAEARGIFIRPKQNMLAEAVAECESVLAIDPDYAEAHNSLGTVLISQGKVQEATRHFRRAQQLKPTYANAYNNLGLGLVRQGRLAEAISNFMRAARLRKDFTGAHRNLALTRTIYNEITQALEGLRQALVVRFEQPQLDVKLERLLTAKKGLIRSVRRFERSLARHTGPQCGVVIQMSALDEAANEYDALLPAFERLVASPPVNADVYYHMACLSARKGAHNEAIEWLQKALQNGFDDWDIIGTDSDLDIIRSSSKYKGLGHKFKPQPGKTG
jgi:tetratricopeptide (TPR) repeat protein